MNFNSVLFRCIIIFCSFGSLFGLEVSSGPPEIKNGKTINARNATDLSEKVIENINCTQEKCIRKCCPIGSAFYFELRKCSEIKKIPVPVQDWTIPEDFVNSYQLVTGYPPESVNAKKDDNKFCGTFPKQKGEVELRKDGLYHFKREKLYSTDFYCIDNYASARNNQTGELAQLCLDVIRLSPFEEQTRKGQQVSQSITLVCIVLILALYAFDPVKNSLQTKCIISYCVTLFISTLMLTLFMSNSITSSVSHTGCVVVGLTIQYFGISFTCWLNLAIYEIFRIVRGTLQARPLQQIQGGNKRFFIYCVYAYGLPLILSVVTIVMQYISPESISENVIKPNLGDGRCWFTESNGAVYAYYYGIELVLIFIDALLLIGTAVILKKGNPSQFKMKNHNKKDFIDLFWQQFFTIALYICVWIMNCFALIYPQMEFWGVINIIVGLQGFFLLLIVLRCRNYILMKKAFNQVSSATKSLFTTTSSISPEKESMDLSTSIKAAADQKYGDSKH